MLSWIFGIFRRVHVFLNKLSQGQFFNTLNGREVCFVKMIGARTGRILERPLMYIPYGDGVLLVATNKGSSCNPSWYDNIMAHPEIEVRHKAHRMPLRARLATEEEKKRMWPICDSRWPLFVEYRARTDREIPVFICEPRTLTKH